jgi:hypothetical protein
VIFRGFYTGVSWIPACFNTKRVCPIWDTARAQRISLTWHKPSSGKPQALAWQRDQDACSASTEVSRSGK